MTALHIYIYITAKSSGLICEHLQDDLSNIEIWMSKNHLILNTGKTKCLLVGSRCRVKNNRPLKLKVNEVCINNLSHVKFFGLHVDELLSWKSYCELLLKDCAKALCLLYSFSKYIPTKALKQVAEALVLSKLIYCFSNWESASSKIHLAFYK